MSYNFAAFVGIVMGCIHGLVMWAANLTFSSVLIWTRPEVIEKVWFVVGIIDVTMLVVVLTSGLWVCPAITFMWRLSGGDFHEENEDK